MFILYYIFYPFHPIFNLFLTRYNKKRFSGGGKLSGRAVGPNATLTAVTPTHYPTIIICPLLRGIVDLKKTKQNLLILFIYYLLWDLGFFTMSAARQGLVQEWPILDWAGLQCIIQPVGFHGSIRYCSSQSNLSGP